MESFKVIKSIRGKPLIVVNNYKYNFHKELKKSGEKLWKCALRKCTASVYTLGCADSNNLVITKCNGEHSHEASLAALNRQVASTTCKRKAVDDLAEKPSKIIRKALANGLPSTVTTKDLGNIRKNIYNARRKFIPALPKNRGEVHCAVANLNVKTSKDETFVFINSGDHNIIVFSCTTNVQVLSRSVRIYLDGTFNYCAQHFYQFFTIHGFTNGHYIPLFFCLLPDKKTQTYVNLFVLIQENCQKIGLSLCLKEVVIDFEQAIHKAAVTVWPNIIVIGCRFHLAQAWYRKIQQLGLANDYKSDSSIIGKWLRLTFSLTYLEAGDVGDCFALDLFDIMPNDERVVRYSDYLTENYIAEEAMFPPSIWAENSASVTRSTNACESFHSNFNASLYKTHPNIFVFIEKLKEFQIETYIKIQSIHLQPKIQNSKVKNRQRFINEMIQKFNEGLISRLHFVKCISFHCNVGMN